MPAVRCYSGRGLIPVIVLIIINVVVYQGINLCLGGQIKYAG